MCNAAQLLRTHNQNIIHDILVRVVAHGIRSDVL